MEDNELVKEFEKELARIYHNATLHGKLSTESDFENDLYDEAMTSLIELSFEYLKEDMPELLKLFGDVYQYGRGGRTVAPKGLVISGGGGRFRIARVNDLEENLITSENLELIKSFNDYVYEWCANTPDHVINENRLEYAAEIAANKNKKRKTRTVVSYE